MKVTALVEVGKPATLWHPVLGLVAWEDDPVGGWGLYWWNGPQKGQALVADDTVLFSDRWQVVSEEDN